MHTYRATCTYSTAEPSDEKMTLTSDNFAALYKAVRDGFRFINRHAKYTADESEFLNRMEDWRFYNATGEIMLTITLYLFWNGETSVSMVCYPAMTGDNRYHDYYENMKGWGE